MAFVSIAEFADISNSGVDKKINVGEEIVGLLNYLDVARNQVLDTSRLSAFTGATEGQLAKTNILENDIFITPTSETVEEIGFASIATENIENAVYSYHVMRIRTRDVTKVHPKFLMYCFRSPLIQKQIRRKAQGLTRFGLTLPNWNTIRFPMPPLPVQMKIASILDTMSELQVTLGEELVARKKQYEYYRDQLLAFPQSGGVPWVPMGEVGTFIRGNGMQKSDLQSQGSSAIHYGQVHSTYGTSTAVTKSFVTKELAKKLRAAQPGNLVIATTSEDDESVAKAVAWLGESEVYVSGDSYVYKHELNPTYVAHFFRTHMFQMAKRKYITGTKVRRINGDALAKIRIPVPSRSVQNEIASTLDKFELLVSDISIGIPAELNARHKQYEYYRDKLLSFKELEGQ